MMGIGGMETEWGFYWVEEGTQKVRSGYVDSGGNGDEEEKLCVQMPQ